MHPNPKRIIPVVLVLAIAGISYWLYTNRAAAQGDGINASGTIEATEINIVPELAGKVSTVNVAEGDLVKSGDFLIRLDDALLQAQRAQAAAALAVAQANYDSLSDGATAEQLTAAVARAEKELLDAQQALDTLKDTAGLVTAQAESDVAHARDLLDKAQQRLRNLNYPDIDYYQNRVDKAEDALLTVQANAEIIDIGPLQANLQTANDVLKTMKERLEKVQAAIAACSTCDPEGSFSVDRIQLTLDDAQDAYNDGLNRVRTLELQIEDAKRKNTLQTQDAQDTLGDAKQNLEWALNGPDAIDVAIAKADVALAEAKLADAEDRHEKVKSGPDPDKLAAAEARVASAQAALAAAKAAAAPDRLEAARAQVDMAQAALNVLDVQIAKLTLYAPANGTVLSRAVEPGETVLPGSTVVVIADLSQLRITVFVSEDRYGAIKLGDSTQVTVDSFADETFIAKVIHIADQAEFTPRNVQTVDGRKTTVYAVKLSIANPDGKLKPGMPADVEFGE